jgi:cardiolipin synthase A/B
VEGARLASRLRREADRWRLWRERLLAFARREDAPLREGNSAALYTDGGTLLEATRDVVRAASRTLDVEIYFWAADEVGNGFVTLVKDALCRGVTVRVAYDAVGSWQATQHIERLRTEGARVCSYRPIAPWRLRGNPNHRNHRKLVIADDTVAVIGSANWAREYDERLTPAAFLDVGLGIAGPIVRDLAIDFRRVWERETGERLPPPQEPRPGLLPPGEPFADVPVQMVSGIRRGQRSAIRKLYGLIVRAARSEVLIATPYFVPGLRLLRALSRAARRGLEVVIVVPGEIDQPFVRAAARATYGRLLRAGAHVFERQERMIHAKVAVVDGEVAVVGTANIDPRSFLHNLELNLDVHHRELASRVARYVADQRARSVEVDAEAHARRPFLVKLWQRFAYGLRYWL